MDTILEKTLKAMRDDPVLFVEKILNATPDPWQIIALRAVSEKNRVAVRSGHGVGKTTTEAWLILWFLFTRPYAKVVCTAPTIRQLHDILWGEVAKWLKTSPLLESLFEWQKTKILFRKASAEWFAVARTAARPENLAGFHADNLLYIIDEASGVEDNIFEVVEGALTGEQNKIFIAGNPTKTTGFFHRAFYEDRQLYHTMKVSSADSKRVSSDYCRRLIKQYGADSDVVRVRIFGDFPKSEADGLIPLEYVEAAVNKDPIYLGELVIGIDVARFGNDETIIQPRIGNTALKFENYRKTDTMTTVGKIINKVSSLMNQYKITRAALNVDDDGVGGGVTDRLREVIREKDLRIKVNACHNGGKARDNHYANWGAESHFALRERFIQGEIILPRDDELIAQLTTRKYVIKSNGKIALEQKSDYKKRIGRSPDRADALVLAFAPTVTVKTFPNFPTRPSYWL